MTATVRRGTGVVPVEIVQEMFRQEHISAYEVARRLGWFTPHCRKGRLVPDVSRVHRALGLVTYSDRRGPGQRRYEMREDTALRFCEVLNRDPVDVGL